MDEAEKLAEMFKALSDPTRLRLVRLLSEQSSGKECPGQCNGHGFSSVAYATAPSCTIRSTRMGWSSTRPPFWKPWATALLQDKAPLFLS
jgi:DNA-binding transcriptional ArsR family regulator